MAQQEGVLCEEVLLLSETNDDVCVKVKVHARVMGEVIFSKDHLNCLCKQLILNDALACVTFSHCFRISSRSGKS